MFFKKKEDKGSSQSEPQIDNKSLEAGTSEDEKGNQANQALALFDEHVEYTEEESKRVLRKIDWRLMPVLAITYGVQFVDKVSLGYAATYGLQEETNLQGTEYSWLGAAFYVSYLVAEFPLVWLMQKFRIATFLGINIIIWGGVVMVHAACHNFVGLLICRLLLGVFECTISPGSSILTGRFYTKKELPFRISCWVSFNGFGQFVGGLLAYAIGHIDGSLPSWKYIFIVLGAITSGWGVVILLVLESSPTDAKFLSLRERQIAVARVAENKTGVSIDKKLKTYQIWEALCDPQMILIFLISVSMMMPNGGITNFLSLIIKGLGFDALGTTLHQLPVGAVQTVMMPVGGYLLGKIRNGRLYVSAFFVLPCVVCSACLWKLDRGNTAGLLLSCYWLCTFVITMICVLSMMNTNISGTTKKSTAHAIYFVGYCAGNIAGPFFFKVEQEPTYDDGAMMMIISFSINTILLLMLRFYYTWENARKQKHLDSLGIDPATHKEEAEKMGFMDKTDRENIYFFYDL